MVIGKFLLNFVSSQQYTQSFVDLIDYIWRYYIRAPSNQNRHFSDYAT